MTRESRLARRSRFLRLLLLVALLTAGCGGAAQPSPSPTAPQPAQAPTARPTQTALQPTQAATAASAQPGVQPSGTAAPATPTLRQTQAAASPAAGSPSGTFADPKELNSYRMKTTMWSKGEDKAQGTVILVEWVKSPPAEHTVMGATEIITIGAKTWVKIMGLWVEQARPATTQAETGNIMQQIEDKIVYKEAGRETVNGIVCKKYTYSGEATVTMSEGVVKGTARVRGQGESWVADQPGLPAVVVRNRGESETTFLGTPVAGMKAGASLAMNMEVELYDINQPITINPPQGVMALPTPPSAPTARATATRAASPTARASGTPAAPRPTATQVARPTSTPAAGVSVWNFDGPNDRSWYADGGVDASVGVTDRPGYLRFTAPSGNDLFPDTNYDAPTLFRVTNGDFTAETRLEFDPTENYQGAGLYIWQDQDNFARLERCFGGLGGGESGICFLAVIDGVVELIASAADLPSTAQRVDLRLQRAGNLLTAWWRDASEPAAGDWQLAGATEMDLPGAPQPLATKALRVGMLLCVDQGASEISADFDTFSITRP